MEINRDSYLGQLIERKHNGLVKVITGLRRVGKSFLLFNLFKRHLIESGVTPSHIVEIALDQERFESLQNWMGTDPTERAFFRAFRDVNHQNGLGIE